MSLLDDLLDARAGELLPVQVAEGFVESKIRRRPKGTPGAGRFADKPGTGVIGARIATRIPEGSGPARPDVGSRISSRVPERPVSHMPEGLRRRTSYRTGKVYGSTPAKASSGNVRKLTEDELPGAVGRGPWSRTATRVAQDLKAGNVEDSEQAHRVTLRDGSMGPYTPERIELHARIVRALLQGAGHHDKPKALFMAGGPASGKSSLLKAGKVTTPADAVDVNPDIVKTMIPEYALLVKAGDAAASSKVHEESSHIAKLVMNLAIERKHHVVVDGTGNSGPGKFAEKIRQAMDAGMDVSIAYATLPTELAEKLAKIREEKTGRAVPIGYLRSAHASVTERFHDEIRHLAVDIRVFDTSRHGKPKQVWSRTKRTSGEIADRKAYDAFMAKMRKAERAA